MLLAKLLSTALTLSGAAWLYDPALALGASTAFSASGGAALGELGRLTGGLLVALGAALCTARDQKTALSLASGWMIVAGRLYYLALGSAAFSAHAFPAPLLAGAGLLTLLFVALLAGAGPAAGRPPRGAFAAVGQSIAATLFGAGVYGIFRPEQLVAALTAAPLATEGERFLVAGGLTSCLLFLSAAVCTAKESKAALSICSGYLAGVAGPFLYTAFAASGTPEQRPPAGVAVVAGLSALFVMLAALAPKAAPKAAKGKKRS